MHTVIIHDARLAGLPDEDAGRVVRVGRRAPLARMITQVRNIARGRGGDVKLRVYAHGFVSGTTDRGGYGLQVCQEGITLNTVGRLAAWRDLISGGIDLYCCRAADVDPAAQAGLSGDGVALCRRLAQVTQAFVRAAVEEQWYHRNPFTHTIDFGGWEGRVFTFSPWAVAPIATQDSPER
jgi:hypothetical protein